MATPCDPSSASTEPHCRIVENVGVKESDTNDILCRTQQPFQPWRITYDITPYKFGILYIIW